MSYLHDVRAAINKQLPLWIMGRVVPRGLVLPLDPFMRGTARCAKKIGDKMPVVLPNNQAKLLSGAARQDRTFTLDVNTLDYVSAGYTLSMSGRQVVTVASKVNNVITIQTDPSLEDDKQGLNTDFPAGTDVFVHGIPGANTGNALKGATILQVKLPTQLLRGDVLAVTTKISGVFREYEITEILGERVLDDDPINPYYYQVVVKAIKSAADVPTYLSPQMIEALEVSDGPGVYRALSDAETIYVRAYPAYFSPYIPIPVGYPGTVASLGPYLLDRVSGLLGDNPAGEDKPIADFLDLQLYRPGLVLYKNVRLRTDRSPEIDADIYGQQYPVWNSPIEVEHMVLWSIDRGTIQYEDRNLVMQGDDNGYCRVYKELIPEPGEVGEEMPSYRMVVFSDRPFTITAELYPNTKNTSAVTVMENGMYRTAFSITADPQNERPRAIKLTSKGEPGHRVFVHAMVPDRPSIAHVRYQFMAKTVGQYHWASSGLMLKPLFLSAKILDVYGKAMTLDAGETLMGTVQTKPPPSTVGNL